MFITHSQSLLFINLILNRYNDNIYDGGNGGFGLISIKSKYITVTLGQSITITVGNGGNGGNGSRWYGTAGGISCFDQCCKTQLQLYYRFHQLLLRIQTS
jgi:hypothetical protein